MTTDAAARLVPAADHGRGRIGFLLATAAMSALVLVNLWHDRIFHRAPDASGEAAAGADKPKYDPATTVVLSEGKLKSAGIAFDVAARVDLPTEIAVAGTVAPAPDRIIDIHPRVTGVIRSAVGEIGARVRKGETLAVIDSAEVGKARLDLRARLRALATARSEADWRRGVADNVEALIPLLRSNLPAKEINARFVGKPLGSFRASLLGGYADYEIARHEEEKQTELFKKEIVGEHPYYLAVHQREGKQAKFEAELEQVRFDVAQQRRVAEREARDAEADVVDAAQRLKLLGVEKDVEALLAPGASTSPDVNDEDVTRCVVVAPFDGVVSARTAAVSQRVDVEDVLFTILDPSAVRVQANVPESDMALLPKLKGGKVRATAEAYPGKVFDATIVSVGSEIDPKTRTVPLRAAVPNPDGLLKIGLFVRIVLDGGTTEPVLVVPSGAVVEIERRTGVFLPETEPEVFRFHPVKAGREVAGRTAVTAGLKPGDRVVSAGAFALKSELILQNETEEE